MRRNCGDLAARFVAGGAAVVLCYVVAELSPWRAFGGMFAAFPAVMAVAVILTGWREGADHAADVALGAVSGMLGGAVCVAGALVFVRWLGSWQLGLLVALGAWAASSALFSVAGGRLFPRH